MQIRASVLIASHRKQFLQRAIDSVMAQTLPREQLQLLVNYSPDPELFLTNWNDLCSIAKGEYVCILGDDDTMNPEYIQTCISALDTSGADIAYTQVMGRDGHGYPIGIYDPPHTITLDTMRQGNKIWSSSIVRRELWQRVGGYDMPIPYVHDYDFWVRCLQAGAKTEYVPIVGWNHYAHNEGRVTTTSDHSKAWQMFDAKHPGFRIS
jgi:teichuronic acid biosynthesis glycosyltransferase TuaG